MRAPNLKSLKLEGARIVATKNFFKDFLQIRLHALILVKVGLLVSNLPKPFAWLTAIPLCVRQVDIKNEVLADILCRSQRTLKILHLEHVTGPERDTLGE